MITINDLKKISISLKKKYNIEDLKNSIIKKPN